MRCFGLSRVLADRIARVVLGVVITMCLGFGGDLWWGNRLEDKVLPWRWSPLRLCGFAAVNGAAALGIGIGFSPKPLR